MRRVSAFVTLGAAVLLLGSLDGAPLARAQEGTHLLEVDTPDKGYLNYRVRITDRATADVYSFRPERGERATIGYHLTRDGLIRIRVVWRKDKNLVLRTLLDWTRQEFGDHHVVWDGRDASGQLVDNTRAFIVFEGDDALHVAHDRPACRELSVELIAPPSGSVLTDLSQVTARLERDAPFGQRNGYEIRVYADYQEILRTRLPAETIDFGLPAHRLAGGEKLLTVNVDDGAGHVGVASLLIPDRERAARLRSGADIYARESCDTCHELTHAAWLEAGPGLKEIGSRRPADYLEVMIVEPRAMNRTASMPATPLPEEDLALLLDYLISLERPPGPARTGEQVYREEGCADCHEGRAAHEPMPGPYLNGIAKFRSDRELESAILTPQLGFPGTAMPPTLLDEAELRNVIEYLRSL